MMPILSPIEIKNVGGAKLKFFLDEDTIKDYNKDNNDFEIFKLDSLENTIGAGDTKYIVGEFRPIKNKQYSLNVPLFYYNENNEKVNLSVTLKGTGYNPNREITQVNSSFYSKLPKSRIFNTYNGNNIQNCGVSLEVSC